MELFVKHRPWNCWECTFYWLYNFFSSFLLRDLIFTTSSIIQRILTIMMIMIMTMETMKTIISRKDLNYMAQVIMRILKEKTILMNMIWIITIKAGHHHHSNQVTQLHQNLKNIIITNLQKITYTNSNIRPKSQKFPQLEQQLLHWWIF